MRRSEDDDAPLERLVKVFQGSFGKSLWPLSLVPLRSYTKATRLASEECMMTQYHTCQASFWMSSCLNIVS